MISNSPSIPISRLHDVVCLLGLAFWSIADWEVTRPKFKLFTVTSAAPLYFFSAAASSLLSSHHSSSHHFYARYVLDQSFSIASRPHYSIMPKAPPAYQSCEQRS